MRVRRGRAEIRDAPDDLKIRLREMMTLTVNKALSNGLLEAEQYRKDGETYWRPRGKYYDVEDSGGKGRNLRATMTIEIGATSPVGLHSVLNWIDSSGWTLHQMMAGESYDDFQE
eukprot:CAMPEP_0172767288 /NCGR_PEP_ID=MMETSP1074-20121228/182701_1 /TAXON_ID=2916 /ORGANISM="Ceratium fusus, Strain PA161109" /LENGTH=114 /DNA_ID=CAMNT_0013602527 /DNA_START=21 /DNA_END=362 /DNA_ORIENTATION=+